MKFLKKDRRGQIYPMSVTAVLQAFCRAKLPACTFRALEAGLEVRTADGWSFHRDDDTAGWCVYCFRAPCVCS